MKDNKTLKYITLITGILTLLLGIYTLVRPMRTFLTIGWILGILLFVNGIELVILSLSKEKKEIGECILGCIFRKNCASVPEERSAIPLQTEQSSAG